MPTPFFFRIEMLPARHGDCLWIEYGKGKTVNRILIDGGPADTFHYIEKRIAQMPAGDKAFELIVLTHVDADHVEGLVRLFAEKPLPFTVDSVWFNGWRQMEKSNGLLGAMQGEFLSALLARRVPKAWKANSKPMLVPTEGKLPSYTLAGGMKITLLSPNVSKLKKMAKAWKNAVEASGISPGDLEAAWEALAKRKKFVPKKGLLGAAPNLDVLIEKQFVKDQAAPNGSSIAFLAEYGGKSALFLGDAHADVIVDSVRRLCEERGIERLGVNAVKVAHHGSKGNTSVALLKAIESPAYLISTNGDQFEHPDAECIARTIRLGRPQYLFFNYRSEFTKPWLSKASQDKFGYTAKVRAASELQLTISL